MCIKCAPMPENNSSVPIIWMKECGLHNYLTFKIQTMEIAKQVCWFPLAVSFIPYGT